MASIFACRLRIVWGSFALQFRRESQEFVLVGAGLLLTARGAPAERCRLLLLLLLRPLASQLTSRNSRASLAHAPRRTGFGWRTGGLRVDGMMDIREQEPEPEPERRSRSPGRAEPGLWAQPNPQQPTAATVGCRGPPSTQPRANR